MGRRTSWTPFPWRPVECEGGTCRVVAGAVYDPYRDELFGAAAVKAPGSNQREADAARRVLQFSGGRHRLRAGAPPGMRALKPSLRGIAAVAPHVRTMRLLGPRRSCSRT